MQNHRAAQGRQGAHGTPYAVGFLQFGITSKIYAPVLTKSSPAGGSKENITVCWICRRPVEITGITLFRLADGKIQEGWVERSAFELYRRLTV